MGKQFGLTVTVTPTKVKSSAPCQMWHLGATPDAEWSVESETDSGWAFGSMLMCNECLEEMRSNA